MLQGPRDEILNCSVSLVPKTKLHICIAGHVAIEITKELIGLAVLVRSEEGLTADEMAKLLFFNTSLLRPRTWNINLFEVLPFQGFHILTISNFSK